MTKGIPRRHWTEAELAVLREHYPHRPSHEVAALLGVSVRRVQQKAYDLDIRKTPETIARMLSEAMKNPLHGGRKSQFAKGREPWNKGLPFEAGGRSVDTRFKSGAVSWNKAPIGTERISKDGYLERKVTDTGITRRDFVPVHHLVWAAAGHSIPAGHALCFRDGNRKHIALENLHLVSRADLMRRNSVHNLGPEAARVMQLVGCINRQINARSKTA